MALVTADISTLAVGDVLHGAGANDLVFSGTFSPAPTDDDLPVPFTLAGPATVNLSFPDLRDLGTVTR